jgi:hypothetical protein
LQNNTFQDYKQPNTSEDNYIYFLKSSINITGCSFDNFNVYKSLIRIDPKVIYFLVENSNFSNIHNHKGDGGAIYADMNAGGTLIISDSSFSECIVPSTGADDVVGRAGGIYIYFPDGYSGEFKLSGTVLFYYNSAKFGRDIYINSQVSFELFLIYIYNYFCEVFYFL